MFYDGTNRHQIVTFHQYVYRLHDPPLKNSIRRSQHHHVTCRDAFPMRTVTPGRARRLARNTVDTHHGRLLLDGVSAQTTVSSGYEDETEENICSDFAN